MILIMANQNSASPKNFTGSRLSSVSTTAAMSAGSQVGMSSLKKFTYPVIAMMSAIQATIQLNQ